MQLPLNDSHFLIGFPVILGLALDTYIKYRSSKNTSTLYISIASLFLAISLFFWGYPSLFTTDPKTLSFFTFIGDTFQALMHFMLWLTAIRVFFSSNKISKVLSYLFAITLTTASIIDAAIRNLTTPYSTTIQEVSANSYDIIFREATSYNILIALNSISFVLLGIYFWRVARSSSSTSQSIRIKTLSIAFMLTAVVNVIVPDSAIGLNYNSKDLALTFVFMLVFFILLISFITSLNKQKQIK